MMRPLERQQDDGALSTDDGEQPMLETEVVRERDAVVVCLSGEIDLASAPPMEQEVQGLLALPLDSVTVDMSNVTFMDSTGLRILNSLRKRAEERRVVFALRSVPASARRVLDLTAMAELFTIQ